MMAMIAVYDLTTMIMILMMIVMMTITVLIMTAVICEDYKGNRVVLFLQ